MRSLLLHCQSLPHIVPEGGGGVKPDVATKYCLIHDYTSKTKPPGAPCGSLLSEPNEGLPFCPAGPRLFGANCSQTVNEPVATDLYCLCKDS